MPTTVISYGEQLMNFRVKHKNPLRFLLTLCDPGKPLGPVGPFSNLRMRRSAVTAQKKKKRSFIGELRAS